MDKEYFVFISYKSEDVEWAAWLQHELEHYHLPASYNGRTDIRQELRPVFRDLDELSAGNLPEQIKWALVNSQNLIVICSPQAAKSPWVNDEVETFISLGRTDRIFPFIVDGNSPKEFFPPSLLNLPKNEERLGGDVSKNGRDAAFVKVVAGILGVDFDSLWNRYEKEKAKEERKIREQRDNLLKVQARFLSEKIISLSDEGDAYAARLLALEILPTSSHPEYPYTTEAEIALRKACSSNNRMFMGHKSTITCLSISPDGNKLASASLDNYIMLWDLKTGRRMEKIERPSILTGSFRFDLLDGLIDEIDYVGFNSVEFSPDGEMIIAVGCDATIYVWNLRSMDCIARMSNYEIHNPITYATFSPNMKYILSSGLFDDGECTKGLAVWSLEESRPVNLFSDGDGCYYVSFSPDRKHFASAADRYIEVWNANTMEKEYVLDSKIDESSYLDNKMVKFSPDSSQLAFSCMNTIKIWNCETKELIMTLTNKGAKINCIEFMPDGKYLVSSGIDNMVTIWDLSNGDCSQKLQGHTNAVRSLVVSVDGYYLLSAGDDYNVRLWYMGNESPKKFSNLHPLTEGNEKTLKVISPNKQLQASYDSDRNIILVEDLSKEGVEFYLQNPFLTPIQFIAFSPNSDSLLSFSYNMTIYICTQISTLSEEAKKLIDLEQQIYRVPGFGVDEQNLLALKGHTGAIKWASFNPEGDYVVSCSEDMSIRVWGTDSGKCIQIFTGYYDDVDCVDFSDDGEYILLKSVDKIVDSRRFSPLQRLITETQELLKNRQLTPEERRMYYLE